MESDVEVAGEFDNINIHDKEALLRELYELIPGVVDFLCDNDPLHKRRFVQMMKLMNSGTFPYENICFGIFEDLIQSYSIDSVNAMRYSPHIRRFWYIGKLLFHGKFINFVRGHSVRIRPQKC